MGSCLFKEEYKLDLPKGDVSCKSYDNCLECKIPEYDALNRLLDEYGRFLVTVSSDCPTNDNFIKFASLIKTLEILSSHFKSCEKNTLRYRECNELRCSWYEHNPTIFKTFIKKITLETESVNMVKNRMLKDYEEKLKKEKAQLIKDYTKSNEFKVKTSELIIDKSLNDLKSPPSDIPCYDEDDNNSSGGEAFPLLELDSH